MREQKLDHVLGDLENFKIGLFLSDEQFIEGILLAVKQDHIVIDVNQDIHYIARQHIQAITKNAKEFHATSKSSPYLNRQHMTDILNVMKSYFVTINGTGKRARIGVLSKIEEDHIVLINQAELLYISKSSIANIHGAISDNQIRLINQNEQLTIEKTASTNVSHKKKEIEIHQTQIAQDVEPQTDIKTKSPERSIEEGTQTIHVQEDQGELQTDGNDRDYWEILRQLKMVGGLDLSNQNEAVDQLADSGQKKADQPFVSHSVEATKESSNFVKEERLDSSDEELIIETVELESTHIEELLDEVKTERTEEFIASTEDLPIVAVQDEEYSSELDIQEKLASIFNDYKEELPSYSEPLGYERSFILPDWKTFQEDQQVLADFNRESKECLAIDDHLVQLKDTLEPIELQNNPSYENQPMLESENDDQNGLVDEEGQSNDTAQTLITFRQMSPQEEQAMLEKQYFSLAKQAACFSVKLEEQSDRSRLSVLSSIDNNMKGKRGNFSSLKRQGNIPVNGLPKEKRGFEGQYVSLMNHAAKMYQQLRDF